LGKIDETEEMPRRKEKTARRRGKNQRKKTRKEPKEKRRRGRRQPFGSGKVVRRDESLLNAGASVRHGYNI
jgi:hypothetical protein